MTQLEITDNNLVVIDSFYESFLSDTEVLEIEAYNCFGSLTCILPRMGVPLILLHVVMRLNGLETPYVKNNHLIVPSHQVMGRVLASLG